MPRVKPYFGPQKVGYMWYLALSVLSFLLAVPVSFGLMLIVLGTTLILANNYGVFIVLYVVAVILTHFISYVLIFRGRILT